MADAKADKKQKPPSGNSARQGAQQPDLPDFHYDEPKHSSVQGSSKPKQDENRLNENNPLVSGINPKSLAHSIVNPQSLTPTNIIHLQRIHGNQFVNHLVAQRILSPVQTPAHVITKISAFSNRQTAPASTAHVQREPEQKEEETEQTAESKTSDSMQAGAADAPPPTASTPPSEPNGSGAEAGAGGNPNGAGAAAGAVPPSAQAGASATAAQSPSGTAAVSGSPGQPASPGAAANAQAGAGAAGGTSGASASAGGGSGASPAVAADGGAAENVEMHMPPPPAGMSPEHQERLGGVQERAGTTTVTHAEMPGAAAHTGEARQAVDQPAAEVNAKAEKELVAELGEKPAPSPDIEKLCQQIRADIASKRPTDESSLNDFIAKADDVAKKSGETVNSNVDGEVKKTEGAYDKLEGDPKGEKDKQPQPVKEVPSAAASPEMDASKAAPDAIPSENVSLDKDVDSAKQKTEEAGLNKEPAKLIKSGPVAEAHGAVDELEKTAKEDPARVMAAQQEAIGKAKADMDTLQAKAIQALKQTRTQSSSNIQTQKKGMVESEEQMRERIGQQANTIFDDAQSRVNELLTPLPKTAMEMWTTGLDPLTAKFKTRLEKAKKQIEERHSGVDGFFTALWDGVVGLPDEIKQEFDGAESEFGDGVCTVLRDVSTHVNSIIASCQAIIKQARADIDKLFAGLPESLKGWAAEQQSQFGQKLDGLSQQANQVRDDFNKDLKQRAAQAVQDVRKEVEELRNKAGGILGQFFNALGEFLQDPVKFIINGLLELVGIPPASFWALVAKIQHVAKEIADDPMKFANNLVEALKQGFQLFFDNIGTHLMDGMLKWLFSSMGDVGVTVPKDLSLKSIITFFLQVMGISWARIRKLLAKHAGEENVALIEQAWSTISGLIAMGPEGLFEMIKDKLDPQNILKMVMDAAIDFIKETLIKQVAMRIIGMLNPAGAIAQAIEVIYKVLKWLFENAAKIFSLIETVVNGIADILAGNLGGMAKAIEKALAGLLPVVIDFLADLLGLGDLPKKVADVIKKVQTFVEGILDQVIGFLVTKGKALLQAFGGGQKEDPAATDQKEQEPAAQNPSDEKAANAIRAEQQPYLDEAGEIKEEEAKKVAVDVKQKNPKMFASVTITNGGDTWDYEYTLVQTTRLTGATQDPAPGSKDDPFEIEWPKPPSNEYPTLYFGGKQSKPLSQKTLKKKFNEGKADTNGVEVKEYKPHQRKKLHDGPTIGLTSEYFITKGSIVGPLSDDTTPGGGTLNDVLAEYGFSPANEYMDADHVREIQMGGVDDIKNLWPLNASVNRGAGSKLSKAKITYPKSGRVVTIAELKTRSREYWFKVTDFKY